MPEAIPYILAALLVVGAWAAGLAYADIFTPADVRAWRRLAALRGYPVARSGLEKAVRNAKVLRRFQEDLDLNRLLGIAGRAETPTGFLGHLAATSLGTTVLALAADIGYRIWTGDWILGVGPWIAVVIGLVAYLLQILDLRSKAHKRQQLADRALGDMMMLVGIMTDGRGLQLEDSVKILARCVDTDALEAVVENNGFKRLVLTPHKNTIELYHMIGAAYGMPMFDMVAEAAANTNVGMAERETYTRLAEAIYGHRLAEARQKAARAKTLVTIPVALMLIPLLVLLGAPTFASIANGLAGG